MRARLMMAIMLMVLAGCEEKVEFQDKVEEYRYLRSLSNPTPEQWKRREALGSEKQVRESAEDHDALEAVR